jgi:hypothetical protein
MYNTPQVQGQPNVRIATQQFSQIPNLYNPNPTQPLVGNYQPQANQGYVQTTNQPNYNQQQPVQGFGQINNQNPQQQQVISKLI